MTAGPKSPGLRARLRAQVADAILEAAEETIAARGLHGASVSEIAGRAGVAVGTVYNYYPDRDGLVRALFQARRAEILPRLRAAAANADGPFEQRLGAFVRAVLELLDERRRFVRVAIEAAHLRPKLASGGGLGRPVMTQVQESLAEILRDGQGEGEIAVDDPALAARMLAAAIGAAVGHRLDEERPFAADAAFVVELFLRGAGRKQSDPCP